MLKVLSNACEITQNMVVYELQQTFGRCKVVIVRNILYVVVALDAIVLCALILMQEGKSNGLAGLSGQVGTDTYWSKNRGRSAEGALEKGTRLAAVILFVLIALLNTTWFHV